MKQAITWLLIVLAVAVAVALTANSVFFDSWEVPNTPQVAASVLPTLNLGDKVKVTKRVSAELGHLVKCAHPRGDGSEVVGRVLAEGGDKVVFSSEIPAINGRNNPTLRTCGDVPLRSPATGREEVLICIVEEHGKGVKVLRAKEYFHADGTYQVAPGKVFLVSDNRHHHFDSRDFGAVDPGTCHSILFRVTSPLGTVNATGSTGFSVLW